MRIGVIVDGQAESQALRYILRRIQTNGNEILSPLYANLQPRATCDTIVRASESRINILASRNVEKIIVLLDLDDRNDCPATFANDLKNAFHRHGYSDVDVVVKNNKYENWLISDPAAFSRMRSRFSITRSFKLAVSPNKADNIVDAITLINRICNGRRYHKNTDAKSISLQVDPENMKNNSRSFRRFLRLVGHPAYVGQSRNP